MVEKDDKKINKLITKVKDIRREALAIIDMLYIKQWYGKGMIEKDEHDS